MKQITIDKEANGVKIRNIFNEYIITYSIEAGVMEFLSHFSKEEHKLFVRVIFNNYKEEIFAEKEEILAEVDRIMGKIKIE